MTLIHSFFPLPPVEQNDSSNDLMDFGLQVTIWWAGLMRGAVSMALAYNQFTTSGYTMVYGNALMIIDYQYNHYCSFQHSRKSPSNPIKSL
ncbi:hypothetical protein Ddye_021733 [Dipteronia dyeriana]|uniref:Uncharacterized protein n=1 Tax=Dipteronia dyeriana TaxID=168575 RepID=A0AAD9U2X5_9ROSI|nr:hypothetical protein Ddye_021733 [Dipteronia dyeriana]